MTIKSCFPSRWGEAGLLLEADFSQLEIVALAVLSGDEVLKDDLLSGRDMHRVRAAELFSIPESAVTDKQRTTAKGLSFILQYGGGAKGMAEKMGISVSLAEDFIKLYYDRYKQVKRWQEDVASSVERSRKPSGKHTPAGYPQGVGEYVSITGRVYKFFEYDAPVWAKWNKEPRFSPTEMKNYPVQGFATADIMALYRGRVYRRLLNEGKTGDIKLINTVHDSIMFDIRGEELVQYLKNLLEDEAAQLPHWLNKLWGVETTMKFPIECKVGSRWSTMKKTEA